ncbi:MAG: sodium:solute symporter [Sphingobacteriales bacterium]|nr:MAG: sodium:solute symporter [Sphingobacteriales bacterium]
MSAIDWIILLLTLAGIIAYGVYKGRGQTGSDSYLLANKNMPWYVVLLGIMATQASAITFLSAPGQAYTDGMRFVQYYFGLPIAMVVISVTFIPIFQKLNVYTAYEYLEHRFDRNTRILTSVLFLISRGLSTGISIYAPSIILSSIMGWNIYLTNVITGGLLIIYTYTGGAKAIAHTQKLQFIIILSAMAVAGFLVVQRLPDGIGFSDALYVAGKSGKLNVITTDFNWQDRYNIWSGVIGGFFLALSYFGTDQSQVGRYISGKDLKQSRLGLLLNGLVKIPMQFCILLLGALLFAFYSFQPSPAYFNERVYAETKAAHPEKLQPIENKYLTLQQQYQQQAKNIVAHRSENDVTQTNTLVSELKNTQSQLNSTREEVRQAIVDNNSHADANDTNYIFLYFVKHSLPKGIIGLLFAVIFLASWGSISAALNSLASSSLMDIHLLCKKTPTPPTNQLLYGRLHTLVWGIFCIAVAMFATQMGSLIEAVNILGSLFYGTILGIFLVAFYCKRVGGKAVLTAAIITEVCVVIVYCLHIVSFLWLNVIGTLLVLLIALFCNAILPKQATDS